MENGENRRRFRIEPVLGVAALLLLLVGCFVVLRPFFSALLWAIILTYSLGPLQRKFTQWLGGSRTWAACLVTLTMTVVLLGPIVAIGVSLAQDGRNLAVAGRTWLMEAPEQAPPWLAGIPVVGGQLETYWVDFAEDRDRWMEQLDKEVAPAPRQMVLPDPPPSGVAVDEVAKRAPSPHVVLVLGQLLSWARTGLVATGVAVGQGVTQVVVSAFLTFFLLRDAPLLAGRLRVVVDRLAGWRGRHLIEVAGDTVRGVIYGVLGTALVQALLAGLGFWLAGVPAAVLLGVLTFVVAVIPFGPPIIWVPAALWLFAQSAPGWGIFMILWGALVISSVDNILRPFLISQGTNLPFVLIFCGVIGGLFAFGLVGVFLGPTLLAVAFRLVDEWSSRSSPLDVEKQAGGGI
ncbi:MAG: AI-2E family transporter [Akkermansiaceae bacterium]